MKENLFSVKPLRLADQKQARIIEGIINSPYFVNKITRATELFIERFMMPEILYGKTFTEHEKEVGYKVIVEEIMKEETQ